jgi:hypothetical protein
MKLTVYHDGQYWVGVVEVVEDGKLKAGRFLFGAEPNDSEILYFVNHFILKITDGLCQGVTAGTHNRVKVNPKRLARQVSREVQRNGISTRAQEAVKLEYEIRKKEKHVLSRQHREAEKERKREIARRKAKDKHRGR